MNALTVRTALDALALPLGSTLLVTGAAGAFGGCAVQLGAPRNACMCAGAPR
jgi:NADPH:quinone reductase-like Zn-dependent oxidoreductase